MNKSENIRRRLCICEAVEYLREGLRPFVEMRLQLDFGANWLSKINAEREIKKIPIFPIEKDGRVKWDSRSLLAAIDFNFNAFRKEFGRKWRAEVILLRERLNEFFHEDPFSLDETALTLKGMESLLFKVNAPKQAEQVEDILQGLINESLATTPPPEDESDPPVKNPPNGNTLPITLDPQSTDEFKSALLKNRIAYKTIYYKDGTRKVKVWHASKFGIDSSVFGNLRTHNDLRRNAWQKAGIKRVMVSIQKPKAAD